jgi:ribonuclease HII
VKGDLRCAPVSAASIVAKVARDRFMKDQALVYPSYGFDEHKGYLTAIHREALQKHGPTALHRRSFSGVKELL